MINVPFSSSGSKSDSPSESLHSHWTSNFSSVVIETFSSFYKCIVFTLYCSNFKWMDHPGWSTKLDCSNNWDRTAVRLSGTTFSEYPIVHFHPFGPSILDRPFWTWIYYWKVSLFWTSLALLNFIKFEKSGTEQTKRPQRMQSWRPEGIFWIQIFYLKPFSVTSNEMFDNTRQVITVYIL